MPEARTNRWLHPQVILAASDLRDLDQIMPFAFRQAETCAARLILLHVVGASATMAVDAIGMPYYDPSSALDFAAKSLEGWRTKARYQNIVCDILVREGKPAQQIASAVRQFNVDQLILGTRSRSKVTKLLLGSVAEQVLRSVNLPVMTVGPEAHLPASVHNDEGVVLYATALREASRPSAELAYRISCREHAKLVLLHVVSNPEKEAPAGSHASLDSSAARELAALASQIADDNQWVRARVETRVVHGDPCIEILATAAELRAGMIVLGATQRSALMNLTRDRTVFRVLAHARCPVLTLKEAAVETTPEQSEKLALRF